jgi:transcriptional regulator with XRE-family HTH domain
VPQPPDSAPDPTFWARLRPTLRAYIEAEGLTQRELATRLGLDASTLSNFLNGQSERLGGLAVALACSIGVEMVCNDVRIGKLVHSLNGDNRAKPSARDAQLALEFDHNFAVQQATEAPTLILRKPASSEGQIRLRIAVAK